MNSMLKTILKSRTRKIIFALFIIILVFLYLMADFFWPRSETVQVIGKIQKKSWFSIPFIAEDVLAFEISTDKGYFYVRGEFDSDGIRYIFKSLKVNKTYEIAYIGFRFDPFGWYPYISSCREIR